jgi:hypothetical protein
LSDVFELQGGNRALRKEFLAALTNHFAKGKELTKEIDAKHGFVEVSGFCEDGSLEVAIITPGKFESNVAFLVSLARERFQPILERKQFSEALEHMFREERKKMGHEIAHPANESRCLRVECLGIKARALDERILRQLGISLRLDPQQPEQRTFKVPSKKPSTHHVDLDSLQAERKMLNEKAAEIRATAYRSKFSGALKHHIDRAKLVSKDARESQRTEGLQLDKVTTPTIQNITRKQTQDFIRDSHAGKDLSQEKKRRTEVRKSASAKISTRPVHRKPSDLFSRHIHHRKTTLKQRQRYAVTRLSSEKLGKKMRKKHPPPPPPAHLHPNRTEKIQPPTSIG